MERNKATQFLHDELVKYGLKDWSVRLNQNPNSHFLGLCSHKDKCIILSAHHIDIHPEPDVINTIRHEIAHALTPGHRHDDVWASKAREIGCDNTLPCSNLELSPAIIDAIRSGADVEITFEEHVIRTPKYNITRLQDKCEICGKVAKSVREQLVETSGDTTPDLKFIYLECGHTITKKIPKGTPFHLFQMGGDPNCEHVWDKNNCIKCARKRPYEFQLEGMRFLEAGLSVNKGAACFHEMGLGKTIMAGGVVKFHPKELQPCLWILKAVSKYQTSSFVVNWLDQVAQVVETSKDWLIPGLPHYIITYDMLVPKTKTMKKTGKVVNSGFDIAQFDRVGIKCVILDECQQIKNVDSSRTQMVRRVVKDRKVIPLSGTPWNNRGSELFPVLNMMDPVKFWSEEHFKRTWVDYYYQGQYLKEGGIKRIEKFKEYTKDLCIRRERKEVLPELPLINRTKLNMKMDLDQEKVYEEAVEEFVSWYMSQTEAISGMALIAAMQKMRHLVALAKLPATLEYVDEFVEDTDRKLVVFAHHKDVQEMLYHEIKVKYEEQFPVLRIVAEMSAAERYEAQEKFNDSPRAILVASQLAAGESINLQTCCDCVMHERQWNPGKEEQCEGRFPRIGATFTSVNSVYAHLDGLTTIDPQMDAIVERKRTQFNTWTGEEGAKWNEDSIIKELAASIVAAHNAKKNRKIAAAV